MFVDLQNKYDCVLQPVVGYPSVERLIEVLEDKVIRPAEPKFNELLASAAATSRRECLSRLIGEEMSASPTHLLRALVRAARARLRAAVFRQISV
jgi:hypothetical protein